MPEFAGYEPSPERHAPLIGLVVRDAEPRDLDAIAAIAAQRQGGEPQAHRDAFERALARDGEMLLVATFEDRVLGFGRSAHLEPPDPRPPYWIPAGWYLTGLVVAPEWRRRGVGHELTRVRIERLLAHAPRVLYFATAINAATIALHARFGFREIARGIEAPGGGFTGGVGVLFELRPGDHAAPGHERPGAEPA